MRSILASILAIPLLIQTYQRIIINGNLNCTVGEGNQICTVSPEPTPTPSPSDDPPGLMKEGYGKISVGGTGGDVCEVTKTTDDGSLGTLRQCIFKRLTSTTLDRTGPRIVNIEVEGNINITSPIQIRQPYLTIDGSTAPGPFTIRCLDSANTRCMPVGATHDIIIHDVRVQGTWDPGENTNNDGGTLTIDGDMGPDTSVESWDPELPLQRRLRKFIFDKVTTTGSLDAGPDIWCGNAFGTVSRSFIYKNFHPSSTGCDTNALEGSDKSREKITFFRNVFALNGERNPKFSEGIYHYDFVNNIIYGWQQYSYMIGNGPSGYGNLWENDGTLDDFNVYNNIWMASTYYYSNNGTLGNPVVIIQGQHRPDWDCVFGNTPKCDGAGGQNCEGNLRADKLYFSNNIFTRQHNAANNNECVSTDTGKNPGSRPYVLSVVDFPTVLANAGVSKPTAADIEIKAEVSAKLIRTLNSGAQ